MVIRRSKLFLPYPGHDIVDIVMIPGDIKEWHLELLYETVKFIPLPVDPFFIAGIAFNHITNTDHELRLEQVQFINGIHENPCSVSPGAVCDNGKLEIIRIVIDFQVTPGMYGSGLIYNDACRLIFFLGCYGIWNYDE